MKKQCFCLNQEGQPRGNGVVVAYCIIGQTVSPYSMGKEK